MAGDSGVVARLDELLSAFNRGSLDVPDGLFDRHTELRMNGTPFEAMLGRSPDDPLVRMLTRGAAGYRFTLKAIRYAVPDATLERGPIESVEEGGQTVLRGQCWLSGRFRGAGEAINELVGVELRLSPSGSIAVASATLPEERLAAIREARSRA